MFKAVFATCFLLRLALASKLPVIRSKLIIIRHPFIWLLACAPCLFTNTFVRHLFIFK